MIRRTFLKAGVTGAVVGAFAGFQEGAAYLGCLDGRPLKGTEGRHLVLKPWDRPIAAASAAKLIATDLLAGATPTLLPR